jgi:hypothetical protein
LCWIVGQPQAKRTPTTIVGTTPKMIIVALCGVGARSVASHALLHIDLIICWMCIEACYRLRLDQLVDLPTEKACH